MRISIVTASLLAATALPLAGAPAQQQSAEQRPANYYGSACTALEGLVDDGVEITSASFHPETTTIEATPVSPAIAKPPHCLVEGVINRRMGAGGAEYGIGFELALPLEWNGRYLLQGGGGLNGVVRPAVGPVAAGQVNALSRGFAVASHDSGHKGEVFDQSFMADQRAALDFAEAAVPRVTEATRALTTLYYGKTPHHSYMAGCSTGGREGMLASQRYPELFDGIVIGAPAMRPGHSNLSIEYAQVMLNRTLAAGEDGPAGIVGEQRASIRREILRQCDALDGKADGMVMNVEACRAFDPQGLVCKPGESGTCLSQPQADALAAGLAGPRDASGRPSYISYPWDTGIAFDGQGLPGFVPMGQPGVFGPANTARELDVDARLHAVRWDAAGRLTDTPYWTNLSTYLGRGSKLMYFHGVSDPWFSAFDTWDYFQRAREANGSETWDNAARFYMVPGMMHCSGGDSFDQFDLLGPMVDWVEQGEAPGAVEALRADGGPESMKLCPHPSYAHYESGEALRAGSYTCRMP
ncbi:tannase/feruloyl esterase family alpha/beta hydrolase [Aurantiacibacter suaedae]|uniref:tannase/feruloyl esterase family alpha/beta hydrolase n=1 Tax=Aurantiacibacter suaedae TaxID=2545755 RepID=UPI0010F72E35|nr:tannase/feruloyl esterase family alpha/beta hydrolase [Aurantiacibacter suaedae]